ncbi:MAG TPA: RNA 2',3'-cyclic phosphodiesterase [Chloroflexota bacterium]|nr:RNA 2',3'-cyclic phosphodiesterase [Chloroflexota bacterium]
MRLFFAVELPAKVRETLGTFRLAESTEYRWVDPALLHVTLAFLGQQPEERLETLQRVGAAAAGASRPGVLRLGRAGSFGPRREPRVLWMGLDGDVPALLACQGRLDTELRGAGFDLEDRPFSPHITLARRREGARSSGPSKWPPTPAQVGQESFRLDHLTLVESRLSPRGPTYLPLLEFPLGPAV